jgi:hypothetical protein
MPLLPIRTSEDSARIASKPRGLLFELRAHVSNTRQGASGHFRAAIGIIGSLRTGRTGAILGLNRLRGAMEKIGAAHCAENVQICRTNSKWGEMFYKWRTVSCGRT